MAHYAETPQVVFAAVQTVFEGHSSNGPERRFELLQDYGISLLVGQDDAFPGPMSSHPIGPEERRGSLLSTAMARSSIMAIV